MAMARKSRTYTDAQLAKLDEFRDRARAEPLDWFKHDSNARNDDGLRRLVVGRGMEAYGRYWWLIELLAARKEHYITVDSELDWRILARDMSSPVEDIGVDECRGFIRALAQLGLIDRECFEESHRIINNRICRNAHELAESTAQSMFKGWLSGLARRGMSTD